ncbi:MAG: carbohydrate ABC transporter permease [Candidatus Sumerlaeia bacterium]|nr:carbohydrate ABC transporter permease [Candidatus Sumerlaeia bacterium]
MTAQVKREIPSYICLAILLVITFVPLVGMVLLSFKTNAEIHTNFWGLPRDWNWHHYTLAISRSYIYIMNSIVVCTAATAGILLLSSLSGYVFARHEFPFKNTIFMALIALLMLPAVLTLVPLFLLVRDLGLLNTRWALLLPYMAGGQIFGIFLFRAFVAEIPRDLFDAARLDGANEIQVYSNIVIPLSLPVLATVAITSMFGLYNDFIWPLVVINDPAKQMFSVAVTELANDATVDMGVTLATYTVGCIPLLILIAFGMKYFVRGVTSGALKA